MSSFYGGKQGRSYRIVKHYDSIEDMVNSFKQGNGYTDVGYGEYVIIDTIVNKNEKSNPENGLLYRRGYNFDEPLNEAGRAAANAEQKTEGNTSHEKWSQYVEQPGGGAIYIGQIVGPKGEATPIELLDWNDFLTAAREVGQQPKTDEGILIPVPGYENGEYKDTIDYGYCTLKNINGDVTGAYLSFNFPYTVFNFEAELVEPYNLETVIEEQDDSVGHPYYKHYKLSIPEGKHGQDVSEIGIYQQNADGTYVKRTNSVINEETPNLYFGYKLKSYENEEPVESLEVFPYKILKGINQITRTGYNYPQQLQFLFTDGSKIPVNYRMIQSISVDNKTKKVTITLSDGTSISYIPREVTSVERNSSTGQVEVHYNDDSTSQAATVLPITEMANIKSQGDNILIGFRNLTVEQAAELFPDSENIITHDDTDGFTYINFGTVIKGQHILRNYDSVDQLPAGGLDDAHAGWLVTVGNSSNGYTLYAYDYSSNEDNKWYPIQEIGAESVDPKWSILLAEEGSNGQPVNQQGALLTNDGLWLIEEKEQPIFTLYIDDDGSLSNLDTVNDVLAKIQEGYKIEAFWDYVRTGSGTYQYNTKLELNNYNLTTKYLEFNCIKDGQLIVLSGSNTDNIFNREQINL